MQDIRIYAFSDEANPSIDKQIEALKRNHLDGMEIRNVDGINISEITEEKAKEVKAKLDDNNLCVWSLGSPIGKIDIQDDFERHLDMFKHTLRIAEILDAPNVRLFSFFMPKNQPVQIYKEEVFKRLGRFVEVAKNYNVTLCHENEKDIYGDVPERCLEILKQFPEIKAIFDPANFVQCHVDTMDAWRLLKAFVSYIHIKDALADGYVVPSGSGIGNVQAIVNDYRNLGGKHFTVEPHLTVFSGSEALERGEKIKTHYSFLNNDEAFDTACDSFKNLL